MENQIKPDIQPNIPPVEPITQPSVTPSTNWIKIISFALLGLIVITGLVFAGIQLGKNQTTKQQSKVSPTNVIANPTILPTQSIPNIDPTASWTTYTNTKYNYSLKLPSNWTNFSMTDFSITQFTKTETSLYLGPNDSAKKPPQLLQITAYAKADYREPEVYPPENCTVTDITIGVNQIQATHKICKGMASNGFITVQTNQYVFIIDELKGSTEDHQLFDQILSTFRFLDQPIQNPTADWKTYINNKYKYEIRFPSSWEYSRGPADLSDTELKNQRDINIYVPNLPPDSPGAGITIQVNELDVKGQSRNCTTLENCIEKALVWLPETQKTEKESTTFLGQEGQTIKYTRVTPLYSQTWKYVFAIFNDNFYSISLSSETKDFDKNLVIFNQILSTFKFL